MIIIGNLGAAVAPMGLLRDPATENFKQTSNFPNNKYKDRHRDG